MSREHYARAEQLLWPVLAPKLKHKPISPTWLGKREAFWYRRDLAEGHHYVLVEASTGEVSPLFDHAALARRLGAECAESGIASNSLALEDLNVAADLQSMSFRLGSRRYDCRWNPLICRSQEIVAQSHDLCVAPNGQWAVLTRQGNLRLRDMASGREHLLTQNGTPDNGYGVYYDGWKGSFIPRARQGGPCPPFGVQWSPDSKRLIAPRIDQRHVALYPFLETTPRDGSFRPKVYQAHVSLMGEKPATATWHIFDIPGGARREIALRSDLRFVHPELLPLQATWWSADGNRRFMLAHGENMGSALLLDIDLNSGEVRTAIAEHLQPRTNMHGMFYNPPNVWLSADMREAVWYSQRDGTGHLYLYDTSTGEQRRQITHGEWFVRDLIRVDEERRELLFTASGREGANPYYRSLYRVGLDEGEPVLLTPEPLDHEISSPQGDPASAADPAKRQISPSGRYIVHASSTVDQPPRSVLRELGAGRIVATLAEMDISAALEAGYRAPRTFSVKAADGETDLHGVLYLPGNFDPHRSYPIIISQYTTPIGPSSPKTFIRAMTGNAGPASPAALASLGFLVMSLDPRGTGFRSRQFEAAIDGRLHVIGMDDYAAAIAELGRRFAYIDTARVGIYGSSYGGYAAIRAMLEYPDVFKVGIATMPPAALHNMHRDFHWLAYHGQPVYADGSPLRAAPSEIPLNYRNVNGNEQAARLAGKLLIIFGELDENVLPAGTLQFIAALIENDRPFDMLMLPGANHYSATRTRHFVHRHFDYFVRHLLKVEPPEDFRFASLPQLPEPELSEGIW